MNLCNETACQVCYSDCYKVYMPIDLIGKALINLNTFCTMKKKGNLCL